MMSMNITDAIGLSEEGMPPKINLLMLSNTTFTFTLLLQLFLQIKAQNIDLNY